MIYLDNAASTPPLTQAVEAALPFLGEQYGNPSSIHTAGRKAALALIRAREQCAAAIGALPEEIVFTSGGTEADNLALHTAAQAGGEHSRRHIITTAIEHPAVLNTCKALERCGFEVTYLPPDSEGYISAQSVRSALRSDTAAVSVMAANNEIGTLQPIAEIAQLCRESGVLFHTDAVQAAGAIQLDMREIPADMLSLSAHKLGGIKGAGLLYIRRGTQAHALIHGGGQENGVRSGTENVAAIAAMGAAMERSCAGIAERSRRITALRDELISLLSAIPDSRLNGGMDRLCGNVNFSFAGVEGESLVLALDLKGVCVSSGSACAGNSGAHSHVLKALGISEEHVRGSLRISIAAQNTPEEIRTAAQEVAEAVELLRRAVRWNE